MEWLALIAVVAVVIGLVSVFRDVVQYRGPKEPRDGPGDHLHRRRGARGVRGDRPRTGRRAEGLRTALQAVGMGLVIGGGVFGAVGLALGSKAGEGPRRASATRSPDEADANLTATSLPLWRGERWREAGRTSPLQQPGPAWRLFMPCGFCSRPRS